MSDDRDRLVWFDDRPVRDIPQNLTALRSMRRARKLTADQQVAVVYGAVVMRVLLEQSERYADLLYYLRENGSSFPELRELALDRARIIAELFLSARREDTDISEHAVAGHDPTFALFALGVIENCEILLTDEQPERELLISEDELDTMLHIPLMEQWWDNVLPRGEVSPPEFGEGEPLTAPPPTDAQDARAAVVAIAGMLTASVRDFRELLAARASGDDDALHDRALHRAREIARLQLSNFKRNIDFTMLDAALYPLDADVVLGMIAHSCVVLAAPSGDFERYGTTRQELDEALAKPELAAWQDAVAKPR